MNHICVDMSHTYMWIHMNRTRKYVSFSHIYIFTCTDTYLRVGFMCIHIYIWRMSIHMWFISDSFTCTDTYLRVGFMCIHIYIWLMSIHIWFISDSFYVYGYICTCMIHVYSRLVMWHDSFVRDTIHLRVWFMSIHDSFVRDMSQMTDSYVTWLTHLDVTLSYVTWIIVMWHDSFVRDTIHPRDRFMSIHDMSHICVYVSI